MQITFTDTTFQLISEPQIITEVLPYIIFAAALTGFFAVLKSKKTGLYAGLATLALFGPCALISMVESDREQLPGHCVFADSAKNTLTVSDRTDCNTAPAGNRSVYTESLDNYPQYFIGMETGSESNAQWDLTVSLQHESGYLILLKKLSQQTIDPGSKELTEIIMSLQKIHNVPFVLQTGHIVRSDGSTVLPYQNPFRRILTGPAASGTLTQKAGQEYTFTGKKPHWFVFCLGWTGIVICGLAVLLSVLMLKKRKEEGGITVFGLTGILLTIGGSLIWLFYLGYSEWNTDFIIKTGPDSVQLIRSQNGEIQKIEAMPAGKIATVYCDENGFTLRILDVNLYDQIFEISSNAENDPSPGALFQAGYDSVQAAIETDSLDLSIHHLPYPERLRLCENTAEYYFE